MKSRVSSFWVTLLILGSPFLMISSVVVAAPTFKIEILPRFAHETFLPISINDYGDIAGVAFGRAAVVSGGNIALVPEVEGIGSPWLALDINDSFVVVGAMHVSSQAYHSSAYVYDGTLRDLGTLGGTSSAANAVNTHGGVVGVSFNQDGVERAFIYSGSSMRDLGTPGTSRSTARDINIKGQVTGSYEDSSGNLLAYMMDGDNFIVLGAFENAGHWQMSDGFAINDFGHVVGRSMRMFDGFGNDRAVLWVDGKMVDLGSLSSRFGHSYSEALDINNSGQIVGVSAPAVFTGYTTAFLYENGEMFELKELLEPGAIGWDLWSARSINNAGQIVGYGRLNDEIHSFVMTPIANAIDEPRTLLLLLVGGSWLLFWRILRGSHAESLINAP